jgi:hypothetical protein
MALSQDEQRVLAEIERRLTADDPGLATCLTSFRRPGPATVLRSPRARILGSLFTVLLVAIISLMVYAMIPFRSHTSRPPATTSSGSTITASGTRDQTHSTPPVSVSASTVASAKSPGKPAAPAAGRSASTVRAQPPLGEGAGQPTSTGGGP